MVNANYDRRTAYEATFERILARIDADNAAARVIATIDDEREPRWVELRAELSSDEHARAIVAHARALAKLLKEEAAEKAAAYVARARAVAVNRQDDVKRAALEAAELAKAARVALGPEMAKATARTDTAEQILEGARATAARAAQAAVVFQR